MGAEPEPPLAEIVKKRHGTRFETARHGYAPAQVDVFLVSIASGIDTLEKQLRELRSAGAVAQASDPSTRIARLVEVAEREVEQMREEAKAAAITTLSDAQEEADRITREARDEATRAVDEAQAFLDHVEQDTSSISAATDERRRQMGEEIRTMQERLSSVAKALDHVLDPDSP